MSKSPIIPVFALCMFSCMCLVDTIANTLPPVCDTAEASAWLMKLLMLLATFLSS